MLRPYFRFDRKLLGKLSQVAYQCLKEFFRQTLSKREGVPGVVISIQTFGDLVKEHDRHFLYVVAGFGCLGNCGFCSLKIVLLGLNR